MEGKELYKPRVGSGYFSSLFDYNFDGTQAIVILKPTKDNKSYYRLLDVWGLSYLVWLLENRSIEVKIVKFIIPFEAEKCKLEALKRRLSFLNINNTDLEIKLEVFGKLITLYNFNELIERPSDELIIPEFAKRRADDKPGKLEKDFQAYLFGKSIMDRKLSLSDDDLMKIYRRLAVLGSDFYKLQKPFGIIREFPTGVFKRRRSKESRILATNFIDVLAFNRNNELALIELKLNDTKLEVLSQLLDYMLFYTSYKEQIIGVVKRHLGDNHYPEGFEKKSINGYIANNRFHPRFEKIKKYYTPRSDQFGFRLKQITLGQTEDF